MVHVHSVHVHQRSQVLYVEVLDVIARRLFCGYKVNVVVARVERTRPRIGKHVVLAVYRGRQFGNDFYSLQELVHLECFFCRAAVYVAIDGDSRNLDALYSCVVVRVARSQGSAQ